MAPTKEDALEEVQKILEQYNPNSVKLTRDTHLNSDLNVDSVSAMDIIMEVEDQFEIDIPINLVSDVETVGDLVDLVVQRMEGSA